MSDQNIGNARTNLGFESTVFATAETSYGRSVLASASDCIRHTQVSLGYVIEEKPREEKSGHRGVEGFIEGRGSGEWSLECYIGPSGTAGTAPDIDALLQGLFETRHLTSDCTVQASPTPTSIQFDVDDASSYAVDDLLAIALDGSTRAVRANGVSSNTLSVQPALPESPVGAEALDQGLSYRLVTKPATSLTVARKGSFFAEWAAGCWVNNFTLSVPNGEEPRISLAGGYADKAYAHQDALAAPASSGATTIAVENVLKFRAGAYVPAWIKIDDEVVKVVSTTKAADALIVQRGQEGTLAAEHSLGAVIYPYLPDADLASVQPATGLEGKVRYADSSSVGRDIYVTDIEISVDNKCKAINGPFGTSVPQGFVTGLKREVMAKLGLYLTRSQAKEWGVAFSRYELGDLMVQIGSSPGSIVAACIPRLHLRPVDIPAEDAEEIVISIEGQALADSDGNDELIVAFL